MIAIPIDRSIRYEDSKIICDMTITELAIEELNDKIENELFERIAAKRGYVKERTCTIEDGYCSECEAEVPSWFNYCCKCGAMVVR